ncbi:unnamed protein product [Parajaminaea phylloscopi]
MASLETGNAAPLYDVFDHNDIRRRQLPRTRSSQTPPEYRGSRSHLQPWASTETLRQSTAALASAQDADQEVLPGYELSRASVASSSSLALSSCQRPSSRNRDITLSEELSAITSVSDPQASTSAGQQSPIDSPRGRQTMSASPRPSHTSVAGTRRNSSEHLKRKPSRNMGIGIVIGMAPSTSSSSFASQQTSSSNGTRPGLCGHRSSSASSLTSIASSPMKQRPAVSIMRRPSERETSAGLSAAQRSHDAQKPTPLPNTPIPVLAARPQVRLSPQQMIRGFFVDLYRTCRRLIFGVFVPFLWTLLRIPLQGILIQGDPRLSSVEDREQAAKPSLFGRNRSFAERCQFIIITSFLLTTSLSISLYEDGARVADDATRDADIPAKALEEDPDILSRYLPAATTSLPRRVCARVDPDGPAQGSGPGDTEDLPRLTKSEKVLRDATVWAVISLWLLSPSESAWFRASVALAAACWSIILMSITWRERSTHLLTFDLVEPVENAVQSSALAAHMARRARQSRIQSLVSCLVDNARKSDVDLNRCLTAIQEVELVSRGFKLGQYPIPPISRIEAAASAAISPIKGNGASAATWGSPGVKRSLSCTSGTSLDSNQKHAGLGNAKATLSGQTVSPKESRLRMSHLRAALSQAFEECAQAWRVIRTKLEPLVDAEAFAAFEGMFDPDPPLFDEYAAASEAGSTLSVRNVASPAGVSLRIGAPSILAGHRRLASSYANPPSSPRTRELILSTSFGPDDSTSSTATMTTSASGVKRASWNTPSKLSAANIVQQGAGNPATVAADDESTEILLPEDDRPHSSLSSASASQRTSFESSNSQILGGLLSRQGSLALRRQREGSANDTSTANGTSLASEKASASASPTPASLVTAGTSERGSYGPRTGIRMSYIAEKSGIRGPNDSPVSKRLSYQSSQGDAATDSRPPSQTEQTGGRRESLDAGESTAKSAGSPSLAGGLWQLSPSSASRNGSLRASGRREYTPASSAVYSSAARNEHLTSPMDQASTATERLSLLGLRQAFESLHSERRRSLYFILALDYEGKNAESAQTAQAGRHSDDYWRIVEKSMAETAATMSRLSASMREQLKESMNGPSSGHAGEKMEDSRNSGAAGNESLSGSSGLVAYTGFEDRAHALNAAIRSVQVKLSSCSEELRIAQAPTNASLHGIKVDPSAIGHSGDAARKANAERIWSSIRDDIMAITQEWEGGSKILRSLDGAPRDEVAVSGEKDRRSPLLAFAGAATRGLESPLEEDEDGQTDRETGAFRNETSTPPVSSSVIPELDEEGVLSDTDSTESLTQLLLRSTSPEHLPPPGLEQIFESIAGMAATLRDDDAGRKLTRQERIEKVKRQRQEAQGRAAAVLAQEGTTGTTTKQYGVVTELKDVLGKLREEKDRLAEEDVRRRATSLQTTADLPLQSPVAAVRPAAANGVNGHAL